MMKVQIWCSRALRDFGDLGVTSSKFLVFLTRFTRKVFAGFSPGVLPGKQAMTDVRYGEVVGQHLGVTGVR